MYYSFVDAFQEFKQMTVYELLSISFDGNQQPGETFVERAVMANVLNEGYD